MIALACTAASRPASAQFTVNPYVDARFEHDSNVFRAPNSAALIAYDGDGTLADYDEKAAIGATGNYRWSEQSVAATVEARHFWYQHYSVLDHSEYLADAILNWKLTSLFDGTLEGRDERTMAPFQLGDGDQLEIDDDRKVTGVAGLNFTPDWRVEGGASYRHLKAPLQAAPDFVDREIGTHFAISNHGLSNLTYGITVDRTDGRYENALNVGGPYTQTTAAFTGKYAVGALTDINGQLGYSRRTQSGNGGGSLSGVTGLLGYSRQLTPKTSLNVSVSRAINNYVASGGSEIDLKGAVTLLWQATYHLGISVQGGYTHSSFIGQNFLVTQNPGAQTAGRVDKSPNEQLNINYQVLRRLKLRAYLNKSTRDSNVLLANFSDSIIGIDAQYSFGGAAAPAPR